MKYHNPELPEGVNVSKQDPLLEFLWMSGAVALIVALALLLVHVLSTWLMPKLPMEYENRLAAYVQKNIAPASQDLSDSCLAKQQSLQSLVDELAKLQGLPESLKPRLHYLASNEVNAFATLGGRVFVLQGAIDAVQSENGLAMILAHELAHLKHRDPITAFGRGGISALLLLATGMQGGAEVANLSAGVLLMGFSREQERLADELALKTLKKHYGHVQGAEEFFMSRNKDEQGGQQQSDWLERWGGFMATHPDTGTRLSLIREKQSQDLSSGKTRSMAAAITAPCETVP